MHIPEPVSNALITAAIMGVLVFIFQQWVQHHIKRIEAELERHRTYQEGTHDRLVTAYAKIWTGLVKLEDWLKRELGAIIGSGEIDASQWTVIFDTYNGFRGEMLFLPDRLYKRTGQLMATLEQNINGLIDALRKASALQHGDPKSFAANQDQLLTLINNAMSKVVHDYSDTLDELRADYQSISRDLLLGDVKLE
jgi:hypothetical protein